MAKRRGVVAVLVLVAAAAVLGLAAIPSRAAVTVVSCGTLTVEPGGDGRGALHGPVCLLRAYRNGCKAAVFTLSRFGVDTVASDRFLLVRAQGRCRVDVTVSMRVVPQPAVRHNGSCVSLVARGTHVLATGCVGAGVPKQLSLTP